MKFPIALLVLLSTSGAYAHQGIRGSTTEDLKFLQETHYWISDLSKATISDCGPGDKCTTISPDGSCSISGGGASVSASSGTVTGVDGCYLSCSGSCVMDGAHPLSSSDEVAEE